MLKKRKIEQTNKVTIKVDMRELEKLKKLLAEVNAEIRTLISLNAKKDNSLSARVFKDITNSDNQ